MASESQFFVGISGNVSEGGLFVSTFRRLPVGELVEVNLVLDSGAPVRALGQVRWLRERSDHANPGFGLQFEQLDEDVRTAIERFCAERDPLYVEVD